MDFAKPIMILKAARHLQATSAQALMKKNGFLMSRGHYVVCAYVSLKITTFVTKGINYLVSTYGILNLKKYAIARALSRN